MKKLFVLVSFLGFAVAANAQCSGAKATATAGTDAPKKACCGGKKVCAKSADATQTTATAVSATVEAPKKACTGSAEGKKCCAKKTAEAQVETVQPVTGTN